MDFWRFFAIKRRNWSHINCKTFDGVSNQVINCDSRGKWRLYSKVSKLKGRKSNYRSRCTACWKWWRVWVRVHEWESVALGGHKMQAASAWRRCTWNGGPVPRQNQKDRFEILYPNWYRGQWTWSVRDRNRFHGFLFDGRSIEGKECKTVGYSKLKIYLIASRYLETFASTFLPLMQKNVKMFTDFLLLNMRDQKLQIFRKKRDKTICTWIQYL